MSWNQHSLQPAACASLPSPADSAGIVGWLDVISGYAVVCVGTHRQWYTVHMRNHNRTHSPSVSLSCKLAPSSLQLRLSHISYFAASEFFYSCQHFHCFFKPWWCARKYVYLTWLDLLCPFLASSPWIITVLFQRKLFNLLCIFLLHLRQRDVVFGQFCKTNNVKPTAHCRILSPRENLKSWRPLSQHCRNCEK